jgi:hypothetical protein
MLNAEVKQSMVMNFKFEIWNLKNGPGARARNWGSTKG